MKSCSRTAHLERWEQKERRSSAQRTFGLWWHFYFYSETATEHCFRNWFDSTHAYEYNTLTFKKWYQTPVVFKTIHLLWVDAEEHGSSQTQHSCDPNYKMSYQKVNTFISCIQFILFAEKQPSTKFKSLFFKMCTGVYSNAVAKATIQFPNEKQDMTMGQEGGKNIFPIKLNSL